MKTLSGGLTYNAQGQPQDSEGRPIAAADVPDYTGLSRTIRSIDRRAAGIEAKQPVQRFVFANPGEAVAVPAGDGAAPTAGNERAAQAEKALVSMKVDDLKTLAEAEGIDLGDATRKDDIVAAIEAGRKAKADADGA